LVCFLLGEEERKDAPEVPGWWSQSLADLSIIGFAIGWRTGMPTQCPHSPQNRIQNHKQNALTSPAGRGDSRHAALAPFLRSRLPVCETTRPCCGVPTCSLREPSSTPLRGAQPASRNASRSSGCLSSNFPGWARLLRTSREGRVPAEHERILILVVIRHGTPTVGGGRGSPCAGGMGHLLISERQLRPRHKDDQLQPGAPHLRHGDSRTTASTSLSASATAGPRHCADLQPCARPLTHPACFNLVSTGIQPACGAGARLEEV